MTFEDRLRGCLIGTAVGDALGLCCEGLSRRRAARFYPHLDRYQLFAGRGFGSDDTDHAVLTAWALHQGGDFSRHLRRALRRWLWTLPAGIGLATLRSGVRISCGLARSGVPSAGNGPVMRAPVIGLWGAEHPVELASLVRASTELTHTDPRALAGALLVARLTRALVQGESVEALAEDGPLAGPYAEALAHLDESTPAFAERCGWGRGVSGFVMQTVPVVAHAALRHRDNYGAAVQAVIRCGGDTDTTAAIVGGILGARLGKEAVPSQWRERHADWPVSLSFLESFARSPRLPSYPCSLARNLIFGAAVLGYGVRRLLPPY